MASEQDDPALSHDLDDESESESDEDLGDNDDVLRQDENEDELDDPLDEDVNSPSTSSPAVTVTPPLSAPLAQAASSSAAATPAVTVAVPSDSAVAVTAIPLEPDPKRHRIMEIVQEDSKQKPQSDESRRMFQRLWTDEDEIELLRGFLDYTTSYRGGNSHHPDTAAFYEQIKSRLRLDFNKNQLVEKLRRLKKKYRNVMNKINSGKEVSFKSAHDQATFEVSRKIWSNTGKILGFEDNVLDDEESNHNNNHNHHTVSNLNLFPNCNPNFEFKVEDGVEKKVGSHSGKSRKRSRPRSGRIEEEKRVSSDGFVMNANNNENVSGGAAGDGGVTGMTGVIEETVKSCLSPVLKEIMNGTSSMMMMMGGFPCGGAQAIGSLGSVAMPPPPPFGLVSGMSFGSNNSGSGNDVVNEKWRKQQILELEVYSRRLELVQDQIKSALEELRSIGGGGG